MSRATNWRFFRAGERAHWICGQTETVLLTGCGLHFHPNCGRGYAGEQAGRKCANCRRAQKAQIQRDSEKRRLGDCEELRLATAASGGCVHGTNGANGAERRAA